MTIKGESEKFISCLSFFIIISSLLTSCGKKDEAPAAAKQADISMAQINEIMNNQDLKCHSIDGDSCPSGVARLFMIDRFESENSSLCSGFMVNETTLVTNHHCVSSAKVCDDTYIAVYNGYSYTRTKCAGIIRTFEDTSDYKSPDRAQDYTVLKVADTIYSKPFALATKKLRDGASVTAWVVDHIDKTSARITELSCKYLKLKDRQSMVLRNCPVISGNSGSPAVNSRGNIIGVIWGSINDDSFDEKTLLSRRRKVKDAYGIATELAYFIDYL
jgi:V8-like Glu-specific endopeptidase